MHAQDTMLPSTLRLLGAHRCADEGESACRDRMLEACVLPGVFSKDFFLPGHFTASAFVLSPSLGHVLLYRHPKIGEWIQPGGHLEKGDGDLCSAALRELEEETALGAVEDTGLRDLDIHSVPRTLKSPAHVHFDVRFFFRCTDAFQPGPGCRWAALPDLGAETSDTSVLLAMRRFPARLRA